MSLNLADALAEFDRLRAERRHIVVMAMENEREVRELAARFRHEIERVRSENQKLKERLNDASKQSTQA